MSASTWYIGSWFFLPEIGSCTALTKHTSPVSKISLLNIFHTKLPDPEEKNKECYKPHWKMWSFESIQSGESSWSCSMSRINGTCCFYIALQFDSRLLKINRKMKGSKLRYFDLFCFHYIRYEWKCPFYVGR